MSHLRLKTKYYVEGAYGTTEERILYAHHNLTSDYVTYYDEDGEYLFTIPNTISCNMLDAINLLYNPTTLNGEYVDGIEIMNSDECKKCKNEL